MKELSQDAAAGPGTATLDDRLSLYLITADDLNRIRIYGAFIIPRLDEHIDRFYTWMSRHPDLTQFFSSPEQLATVQREQLEYWGDFFRGEISQQYVEKRRRVGRTHARIGLTLQSYFAGMNVLLLSLVKDLYDGSLKEDERIATATAISKLIHFDTSIVVDAYSDLTEKKSREQSRALAEREWAEEERALLEARRQQGQKLESVGRLAGGVAHDLNNLLSPILGYSELLLDELGPEDTRREFADQILRAGSRAQELVRQLLAFGRKQTLEYEPLDLNEVVGGFEGLLRRTIREDIEVKSILASGIGSVLADIGQIEQVLMNLAVNAQDAMPEGGRLTIETATADLDEEDAGRHGGMEPGAYVLLAVSDTGCGMDDEIREHLFEPFYSTKGEQGMGLGLATVYGIVKQHGGHIEVDSEPGTGSTFRVYLPVLEKAPLEVGTGKEPAAPSHGSETVLLAEDNEQVRQLARIILERQGYTVLVAEDGEAALSILHQHDGPVHLLLTDVIMPGMDGMDLSVRATKSHPDLKVLYMSGYTNNVIAQHGVLGEGVRFIQKPFSAQGLATRVREVLDLTGSP